MRYLKYFALLGVLLFAAVGSAHAQVRVGVGIGIGTPVAIGPAPVCAYACAPYGYYGPSSFVNGVFIGAGPWYHGYWGPHCGFYGHGYYGRGYSAPGFRGEEFHGGHGFRGNPGFHGGRR